MLRLRLRLKVRLTLLLAIWLYFRLSSTYFTYFKLLRHNFVLRIAFTLIGSLKKDEERNNRQLQIQTCAFVEI